MPRFFAKDLLTDKTAAETPSEEQTPKTEEKLLDPPVTAHPEHMIASLLDTPELPPPHINVEQPTLASDKEPIRVLSSWIAPARPFRKKHRSFYTTVAMLIILVSLIMLLAGERLLILALVAFGFLVFVINLNPPEDVEYKISTQGITIEHHFYMWQDLDSFWFSQKEGAHILNVMTYLRFPSVLMIVLKDPTQENEIKQIVGKYIPYHEIAPKSFIDSWVEKLQKYFPLENPRR